jgi:hypothetical protein
MPPSLPTKLQHLPTSLPIEGAVRIGLVEGIPIFWASSTVQNHVEIIGKVTNYSIESRRRAGAKLL